MRIGALTLEYVNYVTFSPPKKKEYSFTIHILKLALRNLGGVILSTFLFLEIIVHTGTILKKHCSSH